MFSAAKTAAPSGGYTINNSLRFRSSASAYLNRTPGVAGNRTVWTWSGWVKLGVFANNPFFAADSSATAYEYFRVNGSGNIQWGIYTSGTICSFTTNAVYRDPSALYHVVITRNGTTSACYVNGVSQSFSANTTTSSNGYINATNRHTLGANIQDAQYYDGYMTEVNFIDGQALTPSSFGSTNATTGVWQPAKYTGTYGTNGFYLKFSNIALTSGSNTGLGQDFSGNGNYWNTNNISVTAGTTYDAMTDVPTLTSATVANYPVMNPLTNQGGLTVSNANLNVSVGNGSSWKSVVSTMALPSTGQWYWEVTVVTGTGSTQEVVGVANTVDNISSSYSGSTANTYGYQSNGSKNNNAAGVAYGASYTTGDVIGVAVDTGAGTITFYKNNVSQGTAFTGLSSSYSYVAASSILGTTSNFATNFGQRPFSYTPPSGFVALNAYNLPTSTIVQGNKYMDATLYTGNGSTLTVTNAQSFQPDMTWGKDRTRANGHWLYDSTRGVGTTKGLYPEQTAAEGSASSNVNLTAINTNGFSLGTTSSTNVPNFNGDSYVAWQWNSNNGTTSSNTNGSITSTVQVNASAGFSIITYAGVNTSPNTIGHGLGVVPKLWIIKNRTSGSGNWVVNYIYTDNGVKYAFLNSTNGGTAQGSPWSTLPTSSVITLGGNDTNTCQSGNNYVCYAWAEIAGFSKITYYTGNGSTDGVFVYLGFRPKYIMIKRVDASGNGWIVHDSVRDPTNVTGYTLYPNANNAEVSSDNPYDMLSNGFKLRSTNSDTNVSGGTYLVLAFAENPFKNALAR